MALTLAVVVCTYRTIHLTTAVATKCQNSLPAVRKTARVMRA